MFISSAGDGATSVWATARPPPHIAMDVVVLRALGALRTPEAASDRLVRCSLRVAGCPNWPRDEVKW